MKLGKFRKRFFLYFLLVLFLGCGFVVYASTFYWRSVNDFDINVSNGHSLIFQLNEPLVDYYPYVSVFANGSDLNCTGADMYYADDTMGWIEFSPESDVNLTLGFYPDDLHPTFNGNWFDDGETVLASSGVSYKLIWQSFDAVIFNVNVSVGVNAVIILIFLLAPTVGLFMLGLGKWSIVVGLTVGSILGYFALPLMITSFVFPSWVLIVIFLIDVAVFWASWRSGG